MAVAAPPRRRPFLGARRETLHRDVSTWLLVVLVLVGAAVRFSTLGEQSFWYDEAVTHGIVAGSLGHVLHQVPKTESTPWPYYVLLWLWAQAFGTGEVALRSFSALCGTLTIPVVWAAGRRLSSERVGLIAALITAVNPFLFWYSQEARVYSLLLLLSALSLLALVRVLEAPTGGRLLAWGLAAAASLGSHYFAVFVLVPEGIWLVVALRRRNALGVPNLTLSFAPLVIVAAALAPLAIHQDDGRASWISDQAGSLPYRLAQLVKQDIIGDGQPHKTLLGLVGALLVLLAVAMLVWRGSRAERARAALPLAIGAGGMLVAVVFAAAGKDYFDTRNMLPTWPAFVLVVAAGLGATRGGRLGVFGTIALSALSLYCVSNIVRDPAFQRDNWRGAARALGRAERPRAIVADLYTSEPPLQTYMRGVGGYPASGVRLQEVDVIWLERGSFGRPIIPVRPDALPGFELQELRTSSYIDLRYRTATPTVESATALDRLYPDQARALTLLQAP
jgi:mannosyltransferase